MADILDVGLDNTSRIQSGTGTALTRKQYTESFVDFGSQYYGLTEMGDWTGIEVDVPEVSEPTTDTGGGDNDTSQSILDLLNNTGQNWSSDKTPSGMSPSFGIDAIQNHQYSNYADSLNAAGLTDLSQGFGINVLGPLLSGNFDDISFTDAFGGVTNAAVDGFNQVTDKKNFTLENVTKKGFQAIFSKGMPMVGSVLFGQPVTNAFGHQSMRPHGLLGIAADTVHYNQFRDIAAMKALNMANSAKLDFSGFYGDYDNGFALDFGTGGITRAPGASTYTGNMRGLSYEQVKNFEAISKGYIPTTFKFNDGNKKSGGTKIADDGGLQVDPSKPGMGYITANGNFVNGFGQQSYYASMKQVDALAANYGITDTQVKNALAQARATGAKFGDIINGIVETNLSTITAAQKAGTYTGGTAGYVGTPKGGAPGSGVYQSGITGWAGSGNYGAVTTSGAAFGPGTPGYSPGYVDDYESVGTSPGTGPTRPSTPPGIGPGPATPSAPAPSAPADDPYANESDYGGGGYDSSNDAADDEAGDVDSGGFGPSDDSDSYDSDGWGDFAKGGKVPGYAFGTPPAGVQASQSGFIDAPPSQSRTGLKSLTTAL